MRNKPKFIHLQTGLEDNAEICEDFNDLQTDCITWCVDEIYEDDLKYISIDFILARIKELKRDVYIDGEHKRQRIKELRSLLKLYEK